MIWLPRHSQWGPTYLFALHAQAAPTFGDGFSC